MAIEVHDYLPQQDREKPISDEQLERIQSAMHLVTDLPSATSLTAGELPFIDDLAVDADQTVGRVWTSTEGDISVATYDPAHQKEFAKHLGDHWVKRAFGQVNFRKELGDASLSGLITLLGADDQPDEVNIKIERACDPADTATSFLLTQFADRVGVSGIVQRIHAPQTVRWEGNLTATYGLAKELAASLELISQQAGAA